MLNLIIVCIYWTLIYKTDISRPEIQASWARWIQAHLLHTVPLIATIWSFRKTEAVLNASHWKGLIPFALVYSYANYRATVFAGRPLYWFLAWEDWTTAPVVITLFLFGVAVFVGVARMTVSLKQYGHSKVN